jgi:hypothetical protein
MKRRKFANPMTTLLCALGLPLFFSASGCVEIDGGSVEVSWAVFTRDGRAITNCECADPAIAYIRLNLVSDPDGRAQPCAGDNSCRFGCNRRTGATPFKIPAGRYLMSLVAVDSNGADLPADAVESPAAESRSVETGRPTELEAMMMGTNCADRCDHGNVTQACGS